MANRLKILEPQSTSERIKYAAFKQAFGFFPDVMRTMFANTQLDLSGYRKVMMTFYHRSPSWTQGEVELFASFVSSQNDCNF
jgi:hypothetical protein